MYADTAESQRFVLSLHRATALIDRVADAYLRPAHGIGISAFAALVTIDAIGPASQRAIADALDVSRAAVTQRLTDLVTRGLVRVDSDTKDGRANTVLLSAEGRKLLAAAWDGLAQQDDGIERGVDLAMVQAALDTVISNATAHLARVTA